jgi:hypothetical protein
MRKMENIIIMGEIRNVYTILIVKSKLKISVWMLGSNTESEAFVS